MPRFTAADELRAGVAPPHATHELSGELSPPDPMAARRFFSSSTLVDPCQMLLLQLFEIPFNFFQVREMQWNQERKLQGLPTSDEIRNMDVLKKAWNAPGSPFIGQEFDPSILSNSSNTIGSFSGQK